MKFGFILFDSYILDRKVEPEYLVFDFLGVAVTFVD